MNKIAGGVIGALLIFLLLGFVSRLIFFGVPHEEEDRVLAFAVEVEESAGGGEEEAQPDYAALLASAEPAAGEKVFNKCKACHQVEDGAGGVGPHLYDVVGREIASVGGYSYSEALAGKGGTWDLENLFGFLHNPSGWAPGTKMGFAGLPDAQDKVNLIVWLNDIGGSPIEFEVPEAAAEEAPDGEAAAEGEPETPAVDAAQGGTSEQPLLETAEGDGRDATAERDAEDEGVPSSGADIKEAALADEEEAEAKLEAAAEGDAEGSAERYSEQQSGTDEIQPEAGTASAADEGADDAAAAGAGGGDFAPLLAAADAGSGEKIYRKCKACHVLEDGKNRVGPHLWGVVGRDIAAVEDFKYSDALASKDGAWTLEHLDAFLADPDGWAPGTKMTFAGLDDPQDRIDVITYMNEADGSPEALGGAAGTGDAAAADSEAPDTTDEEAAAEEATAEGAASGDADSEQAMAGASESGSEAMASPEQVAADPVETDPETDVEVNTTTGATMITDDDRVEEITPDEPADEQTAGGATETADEAASDEAAAGQAATAETAEEPAQEAEAEAAPETEAAAGGAFAPLLASADASAGEKVFRKCKACHRLEDGKNTVGPHLYGVVGREIASVEGYKYSNALKSREGAWTLANLDAFLADPKAWASGTKMAFAGLDDPQDRIDVITYLNEADGSPEELGALESGGVRSATAPLPAPADETLAETARTQPDLATTVGLSLAGRSVD